MIRKRRKKDAFISLEIFESLQKDITYNTDPNRNDELFIQLVQWLRSSKKQKDLGINKMGLLIEEIRKKPAFQDGFKKLFQYLIDNKDFTSLFTDTGILISGSFFGEVSRALRQKILPALPEKHSMKYLLSKAFDKQNDFRFVQSIPKNLWVELFQLIGTKSNSQHASVFNHLFDALSILSFRIMSLAVSDNLSKRWKAQADQYNVLIEQNRLSSWLIQLYQNQNADPQLLSSTISQLNEKLNECQSLIGDIRSNSVLYGTSLDQSYLIAKISQQIIRMKALLKFLEPKPNINDVVQTSVLMFTKVIEQINKSNNINNVVSQSIGILAYQVTEHKRETGEHYITTSRKNYFTLLGSAFKGGLIICLAAFIKAILHYVHLPTFWTYFVYGANYALAFVFMYLTHSTLATKQPAMTAAALAGALDSKHNRDASYARVSIMLARVWRSQFVSFIGNIISVFPICIFIALGYLALTELQLLRPQSYALETLHDQHPWYSLAFLYAGFTGIFLFLSGIISGYIDNKVIYSNIPVRILEHPKLKRYLSAKKIKRISDFFRYHFGSVTGNIFLGMALGFAPMIGSIFGIPFDIRHITISMAFYAFSLVGLDFQLSNADWIWVSVGVIGIGFINFFVSFGLAFITAMRSRNISLKVIPDYFGAVRKHLMKYPLDFIFPPRKPREPEDLI